MRGNILAMRLPIPDFTFLIPIVYQNELKIFLLCTMVNADTQSKRLWDCNEPMPHFDW